MKNNKIKKIIDRAIRSINSNDYWKWWFLPSPMQLGISDNNALGSRRFGSAPGQVTWEDWEEKVKAMRPIRFFIAEEMIPWLRMKWRVHVTDNWYWIKCHLFPSYHYHLLDLRQPFNKEYDEHPYRYGWIDSDRKILYAIFNILNKFVEKEMPHWYCPSEEEVQSEPHLLAQRNTWLEAKAIHYWWNVERLRLAKKYDELSSQWYKAHTDKLPEASQLRDAITKLEEKQNNQEDEMIARLMKIRHSLWT